MAGNDRLLISCRGRNGKLVEQKNGQEFKLWKSLRLAEAAAGDNSSFPNRLLYIERTRHEEGEDSSTEHTEIDVEKAIEAYMELYPCQNCQWFLLFSRPSAVRSPESEWDRWRVSLGVKGITSGEARYPPPPMALCDIRLDREGIRVSPTTNTISAVRQRPKKSRSLLQSTLRNQLLW